MSKKSERRLRARLKELRSIPPSELEKYHPQKEAQEAEQKTSSGGFENMLKRFYLKNYKKLLIIPALLLVLALLQIGMQMASTGDYLTKGVSLKGGITISIPNSQYNPLELETYLRENFKKADLAVRSLSSAGTQTGLTIEADFTDTEQVKNFQNLIEKKLGIPKDGYSTEIIGSALGESFFKETIIALIVAFLFMGVVVFLYFRLPVPSGIVILCAFADIIMTVAATNIFGIKVSTAGIAAFLMLVGYSVDTDILLTARVLKRKEGSVIDCMFDAMKTGMTMTMTTIAAAAVALIFSKSEVLSQIMMILLFGLIADMINTWIQNTGLLMIYLEKRGELPK